MTDKTRQQLTREDINKTGTIASRYQNLGCGFCEIPLSRRQVAVGIDGQIVHATCLIDHNMAVECSSPDVKVTPSNKGASSAAGSSINDILIHIMAIKEHVINTQNATWNTVANLENINGALRQIRKEHSI